MKCFVEIFSLDHNVETEQCDICIIPERGQRSHFLLCLRTSEVLIIHGFLCKLSHTNYSQFEANADEERKEMYRSIFVEIRMIRIC